MVQQSLIGHLEVIEKFTVVVVGGGGLFDFTVSKVQVLLDLKTLDLTLDLDFRLWTWTFA